ncbi:MAG: amino acid permease [Isosphaeraceae bacterium]|jgi:APA family basic amino acid/polyamine antiporter|nr:MAG: amino acid permease [Isosphaeraceae bacterium]
MKILQRKPLDVLLQEASAGETDHHGPRLKRALGPIGLMSMGVGAIIGTGIFVLIGQAAGEKAGPAIIVSFIVAGLACVFAALCYSEFASMVPVAGSAYTYAYATLGEVFAWIIGWDLILEYAVAASAVAVGWSDYFKKLLHSFLGWDFPAFLAQSPIDYDPEKGQIVLTGGLFNLPAIAITAILTYILVVGIKESARFNAAMVLVKLSAVLFVIGVGAFYIDPANWSNFAPYGWLGLSFFGHTPPGFGQVDAGGKPLGMLAGASIIFFSYIGFDSVSTQAEEAKNPQRDVPIGIVGSLLICTVLYIMVAAVLTGMVPYNQISVDAPVADAFAQKKLFIAEKIITIGALTGITSVLLVTMLAQPRVLLAMSRDGLLPSGFFAAVHPVFRTPWKSTILTGVVVAMLSGVLPLRILSELVNIGTLFAFVVVCAAVLVMRKTYPDAHRPFRVPWMPFTPIAGMVVCLTLMLSLPVENWVRLFGWLGLGLVIYFAYSRHHSKLKEHPEAALTPSGIAHEVPLDDDPTEPGTHA